MIEASGIPVHCSHDSLVDVVSLVPNPRNPNKHPDKQIALLSKIIRHQGWRAPIVVSKRSGFIVAGHGRLEAAKLLQVETVPVNHQDFKTEADEYAHLIADNRIAELAEPEFSEIATLLKEIQGTGLDLDITGFQEHDINTLLSANWEPDNVNIPEDKPDGGEGDTITVSAEARTALEAAKEQLGVADDNKAIIALWEAVAK